MVATTNLEPIIIQSGIALAMALAPTGKATGTTPSGRTVTVWRIGEYIHCNIGSAVQPAQPSTLALIRALDAAGHVVRLWESVDWL